MIKDIFGKVFSQKILRKDDELSKVQMDKNRLESESSLKVFAKMGLSFKSIAQEFKKIGKGFSSLVKLEGGKPSEPGVLNSGITDARATQQLFVRLPKKKDESVEKEEEGFSFSKIIGLLINGLLVVIGSMVIAVSDIGTFISDTFGKIKTNAIEFKDFVVTFDWYDWFRTGSIDFLNLVSFGLISEEGASVVFDTLGNATVRIVDGIGSFLSSAKQILVTETESLKYWLALDVFGIDVNEVETRGKTEERDAYVNKLQEDSKKLDTEIAELNVKKESLVKRRGIWKEKIRKLDWKEKDLDEDIYDPVTGVKISGSVDRPRPAIIPPPIPPAPPAPVPVPSRAPDAPAPVPVPSAQDTKPKPEREKTSGDEGIKYPTVKGQALVTSRYGMRQLKRRDGSYRTSLHPGVDYAGVPEGSPIQILTPAKVVTAGQVSSLSSGYGNMVDLKVGGEFLRFGHLQKMFVKQGDELEAGTVVGLMGNTGESYGAHLHFEHLAKPVFGGKETYDPLKTGAPSLIAIGNKPVRLVADQKYEAFRGDAGLGLAAESSQIAMMQRQQGRVANPVVVNVDRTNNMSVTAS